MKDYLNITNEDNMELMARYPDNYFDLAIVDPEYGIGASKPSRKPNKARQKNGKVLNVRTVEYKHKDWDSKPADSSYFNELLRVSKDQIIWGVNYYDYTFSGGRIVWDKLNKDTDQYGCEIAYCSLNKRTDILYYLWSGMFQGLTVSKDIKKASVQIGDKKENEKRIHPTQKPVKLYQWIVSKYAKPNQKILDTHLGSGSIAIAIDSVNKIEKMNLTLTACELDKEYFDKAIKRIEENTKQQTLFI